MKTYASHMFSGSILSLFLTLPSLAFAQQNDRSTGPENRAVRPPAFNQPWTTYNTALTSTAGSPIALATGDTDGDGDLDVVAARAYAEGGFVYLRNDRKGSLAKPVSYAGTGKASGIVMADFNGDGDLDVAVTDSDALTTGNTMSIYPGNGDGTFGVRQPYSVGSGSLVPVGIAAADFDADGDIDLAVAAYGYVGAGKTAVLLKNNGNGTFASPLPFTTASAPYDIAAGDVTGDGRPDLVIAHTLYTVSVLPNNGAGGFGPAITYKNLGDNFAGPAFPTVALGDVDRDGDVDIVYGNTRTWESDGITGHAVQLRNNGTGTFTRAANIPFVFYSSGPTDLALADLNGDGAVDLLATSYGARVGDGVFVMLNNGSGGFGPASLYPGGQATIALAAADLDGDSKMDFLTADSYSNAVSIHLNPGNGIFGTLPSDFIGFLQVYQDAADVDGDGDLDLFTSGPHPSASSGFVLYNDGAGGFQTQTLINNGFDGVTAGVLRDLNGDGKVDLLFNNANTSSQYDFFTALNNGNGTFGSVTRWVVRSAGWGQVDAFDLDNDGDLDVVDMEAEGAPNIPDVRFFIALNNGDGTFQTPYSYDLLPRRPGYVVGGDFNHDAKIDLAMSDPGAYGFDSSVFIVLGHGDGTFEPPIVYTVGRGPANLATADLDGDGNLDLATGNTGYNNEGAESLSLLFGTGSGTFNRITTLYAPLSKDLLGINGLAVGDVDGDADLDLMLTGVSNDISFYLNNGRGKFTFPYRLGAAANARGQIYADFTGDGINDIAVLMSYPPVGADSGESILPGKRIR
jgi:hypothetical protein